MQITGAIGRLDTINSDPGSRSSVDTDTVSAVLSILAAAHRRPIGIARIGRDDGRLGQPPNLEERVPAAP